MQKTEKPLRIAVGGSMANPPHFGHAALVHAVLASRQFDRLIWTVAGARPGKPVAASPDDRVAMSVLAFEHESCSLFRPPKTLWNAKERPLFILRFDDVYRANTPTIEKLAAIQAEFPGAEVSWVTSVDALVPQKCFKGRSEVAATWVDGERLLREWPCVVLPRQGFSSPDTIALPPRSTIIPARLQNISSTEIRRRVAAGESIREFVFDRVRNYIDFHGLYKSP